MVLSLLVENRETVKILYLPNEYSQQRQREKKRKIYPILMAMEAEWYRKQGYEVAWGGPYYQAGQYDMVITEPEGLPFLSLPHPDRIFTEAKDKIYQNNGNFKYHPGTYIQVANGCWHGKCTFCVEQKNKWEVREVDDVISEIEECRRMGFKEVFDDSGTFPIGKYLDTFCDRLANRIVFGCNMRMVDLDYKKLKEVGFRMLLFGLESANQKTLDKINKGTRTEDIKYLIKASKCGLEPHAAAMVGFPWEDYKDTMRTINLIKWLLIKGYAKTAQMSFYAPTKNQEQGNEEFRKYVNKFYEVGFDPRFWFRRIIDIRSIEDFKYLVKGLKEGWRSLCLI
jgi:radical SAM superfamily enzyme YgiQ (UPF0313 family)